MREHPLVTILMNTGRNIVLELYPEEAPNTVNSFIWLCRQGVFDNYAVERVVPGFVIQPSLFEFNTPLGQFEIASECSAYGFANHLKNEPGCVAMGSDVPGQASGSEFFFTLSYHARLDGYYPVFAKVIEGWDEVQRMERAALVPVPNPYEGIEINRPAVPEIMERVTVDTFGADYPAPVVLTRTHRREPEWFMQSFPTPPGAHRTGGSRE